MRRSLALLLLLLGCTGAPRAPADGAVAPTRVFGEACTSSLQCLSGVCVAIAADAAICSRGCADDADCPSGVNWGCVTPEETADRVCGCVADADAEICGDGRDNDCDGDVDDCQLCDGVAVPEDDPEHCGACFRACRLDELCEDGVCRCAAAGAMACGGECVDPLADEANCGACGNACRADQACAAGECGCPPARPTECGGACVDTESDPRHCGECGRECPSGQACAGGTCGCADGERDDLCPGIGCVDLGSDEAHCGSCGAACGPGQVCSGGECGCPTDGYLVCGGECREVRSDPANCGACGNACSPGEVCRDGTCRCESGLSCGGVCIAADDPASCGACGRACRADQRCSGGTCVCTSGVVCGDECVQLATDDLHCGGCGIACLGDLRCVSGRCACDVPGRTYCAAAGGCVDLQTDESSCGACGNVCPAAQVCRTGSCVCEGFGRTYCASSSSCVELQTDAANCGSCGNACSPSQVCNTGVCGCPTPSDRYCESAGSCVALDTESNCGSCGNTCLGPTTCQSGSCRCPVSGETYCPSLDACVALATDATSCGSCGRACPAGATCSGGTCACPAGQTACSGVCVDTQMDASHCGTCSTACVAPRSCAAGACLCPAPTSAAPVRVSDSIVDASSVRVASNGTHVGVVWLDRPATGPWSIWFQLLNDDATTAGAPRLLATTRLAWAPDIAWNGSEWAVVWGEAEPADPYPRRGRFQRFAPDGTPMMAPVAFGAATRETTRILVAHSAGSGWAVAFGGPYAGAYFLALGTGEGPAGVPTVLGRYPIGLAGAPDGRFAYISEDRWFQVVNGDGSVTTPPLTWSTRLYNAGILYDGTTWVVGGIAAFSYDIVILRPVISSTMTTLYPGAGMNNDLAIAPSQDGSITMLWTDTRGRGPIYGSRLHASPTPEAITPITTIEPGRTRDSDTSMTLVHLTPERFVTAWLDNRWGQHEIYAVASDVAACM